MDGKVATPKTARRSLECTSEAQFNRNVPLEEQPFPNVAPDHLLGLVPGLARDLAFVLARLGGRGCKADAQGVRAELFGSEAGMTDMPLYDQSDAGVGEPAIGDSAVLQDRTEWVGLDVPFVFE